MTVTTSVRVTAIEPPDRDADEMHILQMTDFESNHNKFYELRIWGMGGSVIYQSKYARVGNAPQATCKMVARYKALDILAEKRRKGYNEINPHTQVAQGKVALQAFIAAYERYDRTQGGNFNRADWDTARQAAETYYNTAPGPLPSRIDAGTVTHKLYRDRAKEIKRLERMGLVLAVNYVTPDLANHSEFEFLEFATLDEGQSRRSRAAKATGISVTATIWDDLEF